MVLVSSLSNFTIYIVYQGWALSVFFNFFNNKKRFVDFFSKFI